MKIGRKREHKFQPRQYEIGEVAAWIEVDTESEADQKELEESGLNGWHEFCDKFLDDALAEDVTRAVESTEDTTHLSRFYPVME